MKRFHPERFLTPANFNCPGQIVIAGHSKAVERAIERVKQEGKKAVLLPVSAPFHSPLMKPAGERLEKALEEISVGDLKIPVVTNVEAEVNTSKDRVKGIIGGSGIESCPLGRVDEEDDRKRDRTGLGDRAWKSSFRFDETD